MHAAWCAACPFGLAKKCGESQILHLLVLEMAEQPETVGKDLSANFVYSKVKMTSYCRIATAILNGEKVLYKSFHKS